MPHLIALVLVANLAGDQSPRPTPPSGYRFPTEADYSGDWKDFRAQLPVPFTAMGDFDGDAIDDEAWLLPATSGRGWVLLVFLRTPGANYRTVQLERSTTGRPQDFWIGVVPPGRYETACGKGYWDCKDDEPEFLALKVPAIELARYESSSSIFWWDKRTRRFGGTRISD